MTKYRSDLFRLEYAKGQAEGLLLVFEARGISVPSEARDRILDCGDVDQLKAWVNRSVSVNSADELFD